MLIQRHFDQSGARWVLYYPVDGADPDGRLPSGWVKVLEATDVPIAMFHFGAEVSARCRHRGRVHPPWRGKKWL